MANEKIYLSPERRPKPHGKYWGMNIYEHDVCREIAALMAPILVANGFQVKIAAPELDMPTRVKEATSWGAVYYEPIHTNASTNGSVEGIAQGPEVHAYGTTGGSSWKACQTCYDELMAIYPYSKNRGVKANNTFYEIINTPMLSVYPELAFHDNAKDAEWIVNNKEKIAIALCKAVCKQYGVTFKGQVAEPPTAPSVPAGYVTKAEYDKVVAENSTFKAEAQTVKTKFNSLVASLKDLAAKY